MLPPLPPTPRLVPPHSPFSHPKQWSRSNPKSVIHGLVVRISINLTSYSNITPSSVRMRSILVVITISAIRLLTSVFTTISLSTVLPTTTLPASLKTISEKILLASIFSVIHLAVVFSILVGPVCLFYTVSLSLFMHIVSPCTSPDLLLLPCV